MAQHFLLTPAMAGSRQYRAGTLSTDRKVTLQSSRLVLGGVLGVVGLTAIFLWGTLTAIQLLDQKSVDAERERAMVAVGIAQQDGALIDGTTAVTVGQHYLLTGARLASPDSLGPQETSVPLAGTSDVFAWTPRKLGSETAGTLAPIRVTSALLVFGCVLFILNRLYRLARELDTRRRAARDLATRDALTGLANRRGFREALDAAFAGPDQLALFYLDLDGFKQVNDRYGHATGDHLLNCVAQRLAHLAGPDGHVARLGGDEFVVLRRGPASRAELTELATRMHQRVCLPYGLGEVEAEVGVSIGIAVRSGNMLEADDLVAGADAALYRAKSIDGTPFAFAEELVAGFPKAA
ncbi:MAG TPA: GGDEF domain-containing protein [Devosia sp.]